MADTGCGLVGSETAIAALDWVLSIQAGKEIEITRRNSTTWIKSTAIIFDWRGQALFLVAVAVAVLSTVGSLVTVISSPSTTSMCVSGSWLWDVSSSEFNLPRSSNE